MIISENLLLWEKSKAKQINIIGSRQHPAEKDALWRKFCFVLFLARSNRDILMLTNSYAYKYAFNGV